MKPATSLLFSLFIAAVSFFQPVSADSEGRIIDFLIEEKGSKLAQSARVQEGRIAVKQAGGNPDLDLIFDSVSMTLFIINQRNNSYYRIDQGVIKKAASMIESLSAVAESQGGVLSDLLGTFGLSEEDEQARIEIVKTDSILSAANIKCQLFQQFKNSQLESELCIAPEQGLGVLGEHYRTLELFYEFGNDLITRAGGRSGKHGDRRA